MHNYECDICGKNVEIEEIEATLYPPEYYDHGQCQDCFDKEEEWGVFNENGLIKSFSTEVDAEKYKSKQSLTWQSCGFYTTKIGSH